MPSVTVISSVVDNKKEFSGIGNSGKYLKPGLEVGPDGDSGAWCR